MQKEAIRLLVVEDNQDWIQLVQRILADGGDTKYEVTCAITLAEALANVQRTSFDAAIVDLRLPDCTGGETIQRLREAAPRLPILVVSGLSEENTIFDAMQSGAQDYLVKGHFTGDLLVRSVRYAISHMQAEEALRDSQRQLEAVIETAPTLIVLVDSNGQLKMFNRACEQITGYRRQEVVGRDMLELFVPAEWRAAVRECFAQPESLNPSAPHEYPWLTRSGERRLIEWHCIAIPPPQGGRPDILGVGTDITERKRAEAEIKESEEKYRSLVESTRDSIYMVDRECRYVFANENQVSRIGQPRGEIIGRDYGEFHSPDSTSMFREKVQQVFTTHASVQYEHRSQRDGRTFLRTLSPVRDTQDGTTKFVTVSSKDITEREAAAAALRRSEEQLRQAQKVEALGRLAGGIAHDFNNLLTSILGFSHLALGRLGDIHPARSDMAEVIQAGERAAELTRKLLALGRKQVVESRPVDLNAVIAGTRQMLQRTLGEDVELCTALGDSLGCIIADAGSLEQVIVNLAVNARDAMPHGGKLTLETTIAKLPRGASIRQPVPEGEYVALAVRDTGTGMSEEAKEHIYEPFFTTKPDGKGTGLGLFTVYGIVRQFGGHIEMQTRPGAGTEFRLYFPRVATSEETPEMPSQTSLPRGTETLLVIEDDPAVRRFTTQVLRSLGYRVLEAGNGAEALSVGERWKERLHLVISDVVMPQMSGPEVVARLRLLRQDFRAIYATGFAEDALLQYRVDVENATLIKKPFTRETLALKVRQLLDTP